MKEYKGILSVENVENITIEDFTKYIENKSPEVLNHKNVIIDVAAEYMYSHSFGFYEPHTDVRILRFWNRKEIGSGLRNPKSKRRVGSFKITAVGFNQITNISADRDIPRCNDHLVVDGVVDRNLILNTYIFCSSCFSNMEKVEKK